MPETYPIRPTVPPTRLEIVWRTKWSIIVGAVGVAFVVGVAFQLLPVSYKATATIWVALPESKTVPRESVLAANDLAAQYSQLATSLPVIRAAERSLPGSGPLGGSVSASPLNNYNLIGVSATARDATLASQRAGAVAKALVTYVKTTNAAQVVAASASGSGQLRALDAQIAQVRAQIIVQQQAALDYGRSGDVAQSLLPGQQSLLSSLLNERQAAVTNMTGDIVVGQPNINVVDLPSRGVRSGVKPLLYTVIAFIVGLLALSELSVIAQQIRGEREPTRAGRRRARAQRRAGGLPDQRPEHAYPQTGQPHAPDPRVNGYVPSGPGPMEDPYGDPARAGGPWRDR